MFIITIVIIIITTTDTVGRNCAGGRSELSCIIGSGVNVYTVLCYSDVLGGGPPWSSHPAVKRHYLNVSVKSLVKINNKQSHMGILIFQVVRLFIRQKANTVVHSCRGDYNFVFYRPMLSIYCSAIHSLNRCDDVCSIIKGRVPSLNLHPSHEQVPKNSRTNRRTRVRMADEQPASQCESPRQERTLHAARDARTPKMTQEKFRNMQRSLRNAKILVSKQKRIIRQQRLVIDDLHKQQQQLGKIGVSLDDVAGRQFIIGQLQKRTVKMAARRYSVYDKNFALALHYCSPKCYRFLRKIFVLPTVRSLQRWLQNVDIFPGFISAVLAMLTIKSSRLPASDRLCVT